MTRRRNLGPTTVFATAPGVPAPTVASPFFLGAIREMVQRRSFFYLYQIFPVPARVPARQVRLLCGNPRPGHGPAGGGPDYAGHQDDGRAPHLAHGDEVTAGTKSLRDDSIGVAFLGGGRGGHDNARSQVSASWIPTRIPQVSHLAVRWHKLRSHGRLLNDHSQLNPKEAVGLGPRRAAMGSPARGRAPLGLRSAVGGAGDPLKADVVYVACGRAGLWRSSDFGASFTRLAASPDATAVATTTDDHLRVLVADADGLALSTNAGKTFRRVARVQGRLGRRVRSAQLPRLLRGGRPHAPAIGRRRRHVGAA